jgi:putative flippase GtrA
VSVLSYLGVPAALAKFSTDVVLFVVNYQVQKHWVFKAPSVR